jgi:hypothetical protein
MSNKGGIPMVEAQGRPYLSQTSRVSSIQTDVITFHLNNQLVGTMLPLWTT